MSAPLKTIKPIRMWAEISGDRPPQIWDVAFYREALRQDLRHVRVLVTPIQRRPAKRRKKRAL